MQLALLLMVAGLSDRTSSVIGPDGAILYADTDSTPDRPVANTLQAVEAWCAAR